MCGRLWTGFLLALCAMLLGCQRGPATGALEAELQERLDSHFQAGLFEVQDFRRTGSAPFRDLEQGITGVHSYYDAELAFRQDYGLTRWQGLNLGTLAFAIGANEAGIEGFRTRGNDKGDVLKVHGRFSHTGDKASGWEVLVAEPPPIELPREQHGRSATTVIADARRLVDQAGEVAEGSAEAVILEEFDNALERVDLRMARLEGKTLLGSGPRGGTYYAFGEALARYAGQRDGALFSAASEGSVENASRLQARLLDFGLVQGDVAQLLYKGWLVEGFYPKQDLRAVASLWPEAVHLLTLADSGIEVLDDVKGRRIAIGQRGSGSRVNAILIGLTAQLEAARFPAISEISQARAIAQLEAGEIDALFLTEAIPAPSIQALAARRGDLRFIPIPHAVFAALAAEGFDYYPLEVEARTYPGQTEAFSTLGLTATLLTHMEVEDARVEQVLDLLMGGDALARNYYRAAFISPETMGLGLALPLHPAAERFYQRQQEATALTP